MPEPTGSSVALNQKEGLIETNSLIGVTIFFYLMSLFWLISYLKLICTDISTYNFPPPDSEVSADLVCTRGCGTLKRRDIIHCSACGTCNAYHDHHCGVVQVCVCGANYKYFVLFMFYAAMMFVAMGSAVTMLA